MKFYINFSIIRIISLPGMAKVSDSREGSSYKDLIFFWSQI